MPNEDFWAELSQLTSLELQALFARVAGLFPGGAREAAKLAERVYSGLIEPEETQEEGIKIEQVAAFLKRVGTPPPMLVQGMIPEKSLILLTGKPKHCKSFVAADVAHDIALGKPVFGTFTVNTPGAVVYLAMEDGEYEIANRLMARGIKNRDEDLPFYVCPERFQMTEKAHWDRLANMVAPIAPRLILIDTAAEALGIKDWSNRSEITEKMSPMRGFAREHCSILLVAHNRKAEGQYGDEIAGTNAFTGAVDGWISITDKSVQENGNVQLRYNREGRGGLRGSGRIEMDTHTLKFTELAPEDLDRRAKEKAEQEEERRKRAKYKQVEDALVGGAMTASAIAATLEVSPPTASRLLKEMLEGEMIIEAGTTQSAGGSRGGKRQTLYDLPDRKQPETEDSLGDFFDDGERREVVEF